MDARKIKIRNSRSIPALLTAAKSKDDELARRAIEALGKVGTASTLARLGRLRGSTPRVRKSMAFARSLLAHRHGVKGWALKLPRGARMMPFDSDRAVALNSKSLSSKEWPAIRRSLRVVKEVVPPADKAPLAFQCGSEQYLLLVNPLLERGVSALSRPLVAAALVKFSRATQRWYVAEYFFAIHRAADKRESLACGRREPSCMPVSPSRNARTCASSFNPSTHRSRCRLPSRQQWGRP